MSIASFPIASAAIAGRLALVVYIRPDSDINLDGWTDELDGTTNIYQSIDEASVDDNDYVQSPFMVAATADLKVRLYEGVSMIAEWTHTNISDSFVTATQTLSQGEFDAITDFSDLFIELDDNQGSVYRFSLGNPVTGVAYPAKVRYRYKKLAA